VFVGSKKKDKLGFKSLFIFQTSFCTEDMADAINLFVDDEAVEVPVQTSPVKARGRPKMVFSPMKQALNMFVRLILCLEPLVFRNTKTMYVYWGRSEDGDVLISSFADIGLVAGNVYSSRNLL
jgi:hypothetical protein